MKYSSSILLTGGTGFIGKNILPILSGHYDVLAPGRQELDLSDDDSVRSYLGQHQIDILVHCAILNPDKSADANKGVYDDTMAMFKRLASHSFSRIVFIGSGAEFNKSRNISMAREDDLAAANPTDEYGRAKRDLTLLARASRNFYNARVFGCYGPNEPDRRFIRHAITCCLRNEPITIRQNCRFSYISVKDLGRAILRLIESQPQHHDYNLCGGKPFLLSELAEIVKRQLNADVPIQLFAPGLANEYTGDDTRFISEFPDFKYTSIEDGIAEEISWLKGLAK